MRRNYLKRQKKKMSKTMKTKMTKKSPNLIMSRLSTMTYEASKILGVPLIDIALPDDETLKCTLLNMDGKCEYCEEKDANTLDHYMCLVKNSKPTEYCNDTWNLIPCCKDCNSSKGGKTFNEWFHSKSAKNPFTKMRELKKKCIQRKFQQYTCEFEKHHIVKSFSFEEYDDIMSDFKEVLLKTQERIKELHKKTIFIRANTLPKHTYETRYVQNLKTLM